MRRVPFGEPDFRKAVGDISNGLFLFMGCGCPHQLIEFNRRLGTEKHLEADKESSYPATVDTLYCGPIHFIHRRTKEHPMPQTPHLEKHFTSSKVVRDIVIGMADGLTVPFALAAGLSGAVTSTAIIVTAGLAEIAAGSIAMGLGGYLAARSDAEHYESERS